MSRNVISRLASVGWTSVVFATVSGVAAANGLLANWKLNESTGSTAFADTTGNGHDGTLVGTDTLTSVPGVIGTGLYFSGAAAENYISVPNTTNLGGGSNTLTLSAWVNIPSSATSSSAVRMIFNMFDNAGNYVYKFGTRYSTGVPTARGLCAGADNVSAGTDYANSTSFWNRTDGSGWVADTWEQVTFVYYGGNDATAASFAQMYVNGMLVRSYIWGLGSNNGARPLPSPASEQDMRLGFSNYGGGTNFQEWLGGLNDLSIWNVNLTGPYSPTDPNWVRSSTGGEISAMYNTPMYNNHTGALSQYGAKAMDKLFTLYESASTTSATAVTTSDGTLAWKYVASGLPGTSGSAGYIAETGQYYIQLDSSGGGVETGVMFGDANVDGTVNIADLSKVLTNYDKTGMTWADGDFNGDGTVNISDLSNVLTNYGA